MNKDDFVKIKNILDNNGFFVKKDNGRLKIFKTDENGMVSSDQ